MTIKQFAKDNFLKLEVVKIFGRSDMINDDWAKDANHYQYRITCYQGDNYGKHITGEYSQGSGIKGQPKIEDILNSLIMDASGAQGTFEDFCSEFGYDVDSKKAEKTFHACQWEASMLKLITGDKFQELMECETL